MYCTVLIFCMLSAIKNSVCNYCEPDSTGLSNCHDGGCNNPKYTNEICICDFSKNIMKGIYCGVYENYCLRNPCTNNEECISGIGHHICKCSEQFRGINCEIPIKKDDKFKHIRRPSIYYRIKSTQGEELYILLVSDTFGDKKYYVTIEYIVQQFNFRLDDLKKKINVPDLVKLCSEKLSSKDFTVNKCNGPDNDDCQDMCNFIPKIYGSDSEVEFAFIGPYFITKSKFSKEKQDNTELMGIKYYLEFQLYPIYEEFVEYKFRFIHFVGGDELSRCLPLIVFDSDKVEAINNSISNSQVRRNHPILVKRNVQWTHKVTVFINNYLCSLLNSTVHYTFDWKIFSANKHIFNYQNEKGLPYLDDSVMHGHPYLKIDSYKLPMGIHAMFFNVTSHYSTKNQKLSNLFVTLVETQLDRLIAKIAGPSPLRIQEDTFLTLDASNSYNPNEKDTKKDLLFTWECNIIEDESCTQFTTSEPKITLNKKLNKLYEYIFTLTLSVNDNYIQSIGKPKEGIAKITVKHTKKKLTIECLRNCKPLANPSSDIYLEAKINFIGNEFKWYYQEFNVNTNDLGSPADKISLTDVPARMLIVKKNMLQYGKKYSFIVTNPNYKLVMNITVTTISKPKVGSCTILPKSGIAGQTLFTISCTNFNDDNNTENIFEYYQKNKNDETSIGVLLKRGNENMSNIKLTSSKYLTVKAINKHGASVQVNLTADITECNIYSMNNLFKELKTNSMKNDISRTVSIVSILSDLLHDNHINKFNTLFKVLSQIPFSDYIFGNVQFVLILQKVIKDYNEVTKGNMEINGVLKISTQLLKVSDSLHGFLKISNEYDKIVETDKVEQIKEVLLKNLELFQTNQYNIAKPKNPSERFYWSSINNLNIITENTENILKMFGKSIILELLPYERSIVCREEIMDGNACILSRDWIKNRTNKTKVNEFLYNIINIDLGKELISNGEEWGITIFHVENNLIQKFDDNEVLNNNYKIVSIDVSRIDQYNRRELTTHNKFNKSIDIHFKMNNTKARNPKDYTIWVPSKNCSDAEFDKTILVYRIDMMNIQQIFVTLSGSTHDLRFAWLNDKRPDFKIMNNNKYAINIKAGVKYEFTLKTVSEHQNNIHYVGISANMDQRKTTQIYMSYVNFSMDLFSPQCLFWNGMKWTPEGIIVGITTNEFDIHCETNHLSLFGGLMLTLPNITDPVQEIIHYGSISNNMICIIIVAIVFITYTILLVWSMYQDKKDVSRGEIIILHDNYPGEDEVYLITVYTGNSLEAGTTANVCIQLYGNMGSSRAHWLYNYDSDVLQRFNDDWFIIFTPKSLGDLQYIRIWHDNYGNRPDWYCKRVEVTDVREKKKWNFVVDRWFSLSSTIDNIEQTIKVGNPQDRKRQVADDVELTIREDHQWASVFIRHPRSLITRSQRLSKIMCILLSAMLISLIFYEFNETDEEQFLTFEITLKQVSISIQSSIIQMIMTFGISYCFNKSGNFQKYILVEDQIKEQNNVDEANSNYYSVEIILNLKFNLETWWRKILVLFVRKRLYFPAQTEKKFIKNTKINSWLITAWTLCLFVYVSSSALIIGYGLKLGPVKSLHWLMSIIITMLQNSFLIEPLLIIITSCVLYKFNQEQNIITIYQIKLANYRTNTKHQLQNLVLIQTIRESRNRYVYNPLSPTDAQVLQTKQVDKMRRKRFKDNATTCLLTILTSLCCIGALYSFNSPKHIIYANNINKLFLKNILQRTTMDLEMLKKFLTESLIGPLHINEYYNGIPITNMSDTYHNEIQHPRGWYNLYNSKLVNGGIRLTQNRIRADNWENDISQYKEGWIEITEINNITAWVYRSIPVIKYFGLWFPGTHNSGFILDLTGGLSDYKQKLNTYLANGWLDNRTRNLVIEFHTYTPNIDCITVFKIQFQTTSGLLYTVNNAIYSVPSSSVFVSWYTFVFTLVFMIAFAGTAVRLVGSVSFMLFNYDAGERFWTAYECALLAVVLCATFAVAGRWRLMELAVEQYEQLKETAYVASVTDMCRAHEHVAALVALVGAMGLFRVFRLVAYRKRVSHADRTWRSAGGPVAAVAAYAFIITFGTWYCTARVADGQGLFNVLVFGRHAFDLSLPQNSAYTIVTIITVMVFLFFNAAAISIITKYYVVSKTVSG